MSLFLSIRFLSSHLHGLPIWSIWSFLLSLTFLNPIAAQTQFISFVSSYLRIFSSSALLCFSSSYPHYLQYLPNFSSSALLGFSSSYLPIFLPSHLPIFSSSGLHWIIRFSTVSVVPEATVSVPWRTVQKGLALKEPSQPQLKVISVIVLRLILTEFPRSFWNSIEEPVLNTYRLLIFHKLFSPLPC